MSSATKEILGRVRQLIPPMLDKFHKGESLPPKQLRPTATGLEQRWTAPGGDGI